ncbi:MAG: PDZ domain-containing protein, partial [Pirellulales bacterium]|nr:PDZ domain-containing protein [Pirellulales bacterium]
MFRRVFVLSVVLLLFVALLRVPGRQELPDEGVFVPRALAVENENRRRDYELIEVLADALDEIDRSYYRDVDRAELVEAAIHGMMAKLDKNSRFMTGEEAISPLRRQLQGEYDGVGIDLTAENGSTRVVSPLVGSPAYEAGIRPGDQITAIGGESTAGANLKDVMGRMRGEPGSEVEITLVDSETNETKNVKLKSAAIKVETVFGARRNEDDSWDFMLDPEHKIGYIRLVSFSRTCLEPLHAAIEQLLAN